MFIKTIEGKLQNLRLLQTVKVVDNLDETFSVGYVQMNGEIVKEGSYNTEADAEAVVTEIINKITGEEQ